MFVQVYIQNEYCEGGSLQNRIQEFRQSGGRFTETELKKIVMHVAKVSFVCVLAFRAVYSSLFPLSGVGNKFWFFWLWGRK